MAGKTTSTGKQIKTKEKVHASRAAKGKDSRTVDKVKARVKTARTKDTEMDPPQPDTPVKGNREIVIKGEIPEALAYFLEVYGRLGRG